MTGATSYSLEQPMLTSGTLRIGGNTALPGVLRSLGHDPDGILRGAGLESDLLSDPDNVIPFSALGKVYAHCARVTDCAHIGLLVGGTASLAWLGRVGFIARNSQDVRSALASIGRYLHHHDRSAVVALKVIDQWASLSYSPLVTVEGLEQVLGGAIAIGANVMRELCGPAWNPAKVTLAIRRPVDVRPYETFFRGKVTFEAAESALLFSPEWLSQPIGGAEPQLLRLLMKEIDHEAHAFHPAVLPFDVQRVARTFIGSGQCSTETICRMFGVSPRTLHRHLAEHGTSLKKLIEAVHFETAKHLMQNTSASLSRISEMLDYSELSAFSRAFSRWSGMPPGKWRRAHRSR